MINTGSKNRGGGGNYRGGGVTETLDFLPHSGLHKLFLCRETFAPLYVSSLAPDVEIMVDLRILVPRKFWSSQKTFREITTILS